MDTDVVCWGCRAQAIVRRNDEHEHEHLDKQAGPGEPRRADGRVYPVRPMTSEELEEL